MLQTLDAQVIGTVIKFLHRYWVEKNRISPPQQKLLNCPSEEMGFTMGTQLDRKGYIGLLRTFVIVVAICFVAYMALRRSQPPNTYLTPTQDPVPTAATIGIVGSTSTPPPTATFVPVPTIVPTLPEEIEVIEWKITDICYRSVRTGVQITGALISGGNPPYWVEASYIEGNDPPFSRRKAVANGTKFAYYVVDIDPPLDFSAGRWVNVVVRTVDPGRASDWRDKLYFPVQDCGSK